MVNTHPTPALSPSIAPDALDGALGVESYDAPPWRVYRLLLRQPGQSAADIAASLDMQEEDVRRHVEWLVSLGLVQPRPGQDSAWTITNPDQSLAAMVEQARREASERLRAVDGLHSTAYALREEYQRARLDQSKELIVHSTGQDNIMAMLQKLIAHSSQSLQYTVPWRPSKEQLEEARASDAYIFDRCESVQALYLTSAMCDRHMVEYLSWMTGQGAQVRLTPTIPATFHIGDGEMVQARYDARSEAGIVHVFVPSVVKAYSALFKVLWEAAQPFTPSAARAMVSAAEPEQGEQELSPAEQSLLLLLAEGHKDDAIARSMQVSVRTVRRMIADMCERNGVPGRFKLAVVATQRGWVS